MSKDYKRVPVGRVRVECGQHTPYGTIAPLVREAIDREGCVEAHSLSKSLGHTPSGVAGALKAEAKAGRAVIVFRGVFARPDVAKRIRALLDAVKAGAK